MIRLLLCVALLLPTLARADAPGERAKTPAEEAGELRAYLALGAEDAEVPALLRRVAFLEALARRQEAERAAAAARAQAEATARADAEAKAKKPLVDVRVRVDLGPKSRRAMIISLAIGGAAIGALVVGLAVGISTQSPLIVYTPSTLGPHTATR